MQVSELHYEKYTYRIIIAQNDFLDLKQNDMKEKDSGKEGSDRDRAAPSSSEQTVTCTRLREKS